MSRAPFLTKLTLRNFRSIRSETVEFANPLILVGRNGSGKSNFVDAIAFLSECTNRPLSSVLMKRGNLIGVCSQIGNGQHATNMVVRADFLLDASTKHPGHYAFQLDTASYNGFRVVREQCVMPSDDGKSIYFDRNMDQFSTNIAGLNPAIESQSLALPIVGGTREISPLIKMLAAMRVYAIEPPRMRGMHYLDTGLALERDGSNTASVLRQIEQRDPQRLSRVRELVGAVVPGVVDVKPLYDDNNIILLLSQVGPDGFLLGFADIGMSDGTLRTIGLVAAAMQDVTPSLMAIEEPEATVHPGALDAIADLLDMAAQRSQVVITTHSPELLDTKWIQPENLRVVEWEKGTTHISKLGEAPIKALQQHLMGAGELLRANALDAAPLLPTDTSDLFDENLA